MLNHLESFLNELQMKRVNVLNQNVDLLVEEKVKAYAEKVRSEVLDELKAETNVLDIKIEAVSEAIQVVKANLLVDEVTSETINENIE